MNQALVAQTYARIHARDPRALAYYARIKQCAKAGNRKCLMTLRQLRAYALLRTQGVQGPDYGGAPVRASHQGPDYGGQPVRAPQQQALDSQRAAALVISEVQLGKTSNLQAIQSAAQAGNPQGVTLLRLVSRDPAVQTALGLDAAAGALESPHPGIRPLPAAPAARPNLALMYHPAAIAQAQRQAAAIRAQAAVPAHLRAVAAPAHLLHGVTRPEFVHRPGFGIRHGGYLRRPGGYHASWAFGRRDWFRPRTGWRTGWFGWRRTGWRGWGYRPGFGWVWGYPGTLIIDASAPYEVLSTQADGSAAPADPSTLPADAAQLPDPSTAPPAADGGDDTADTTESNEAQEDATDDSKDDDSSGAWPWQHRPRPPGAFGRPRGPEVFGRPIVRRRWRDGWPHHIRANDPPPPPAPLALPAPPQIPAPPIDTSGWRPAPPRGAYGRPRPPVFGRPRSRYQPGVFGAPAYGPGAPGQLGQLEAINDQLNAANPAGDDPNTDASGFAHGGGHGGFSHGGGWGGWGRRGWAGAGRGYGLWGGAYPGVYVPVYAEPESAYGAVEDLYGDDASGADSSPDFGAQVAPILAAAGPNLAPSLAQSISYTKTLGAQAASAAGLNVAQGSSPQDAMQDDMVKERARQAAEPFLQHIAAAPLAAGQLQQAAQAAHDHVYARAATGATRPPPAGWTMQPISVQRALAILGLYKGAIDGVVNQATKNAAKAFQAAQRLAADGIVGVHTQGALEDAAKRALVVLQAQLRSAFGSYYAAPAANVSGFSPAAAFAAVKPGLIPALGGLLGGLFGARWGRPKPGLHLPRHHVTHHGRPPAWPAHMTSGGDDADTVREALKKALAGLPLDKGQSDALKRYIQDTNKTLPAPTASGGTWDMPLVYGRDWLGNPEFPYMATGSFPRVAVGYGRQPQMALGGDPRVAVGGPFAAALLGAGLYATLDGYKHGFPHVADTLLGPKYGQKVVDLTRHAGQVMNVSGYSHRGWYGRPPMTMPDRMRSGSAPTWRGWYGRPPTNMPNRMRSGDDSGYAWRGWYGHAPTTMPDRMKSGGYGWLGSAGRAGRYPASLPSYMRAGIDTSTQARPDLPSPLIESLAAAMRKAVA